MDDNSHASDLGMLGEVAFKELVAPLYEHAAAADDDDAAMDAAMDAAVDGDDVSEDEDDDAPPPPKRAKASWPRPLKPAVTVFNPDRLPLLIPLATVDTGKWLAKRGGGGKVDNVCGTSSTAPPNWDLCACVRELIQNALDEPCRALGLKAAMRTIVTPDGFYATFGGAYGVELRVSINEATAEVVLVVLNVGTAIHRRAFLNGSGDKTDGDAAEFGTAGGFGYGLKDAIRALLRELGASGIFVLSQNATPLPAGADATAFTPRRQFDIVRRAQDDSLGVTCRTSFSRGLPALARAAASTCAASPATVVAVTWTTRKLGDAKVAWLRKKKDAVLEAVREHVVARGYGGDEDADDEDCETRRVVKVAPLPPQGGGGDAAGAAAAAAAAVDVALVIHPAAGRAVPVSSADAAAAAAPQRRTYGVYLEPGLLFTSAREQAAAGGGYYAPEFDVVIPRGLLEADALNRDRIVTWSSMEWAVGLVLIAAADAEVAALTAASSAAEALAAVHNHGAGTRVAGILLDAFAACNAAAAAKATCVVVKALAAAETKRPAVVQDFVHRVLLRGAIPVASAKHAEELRTLEESRAFHPSDAVVIADPVVVSAPCLYSLLRDRRCVHPRDLMWPRILAWATSKAAWVPPTNRAAEWAAVQARIGLGPLDIYDARLARMPFLLQDYSSHLWFPARKCLVIGKDADADAAAAAPLATTLDDVLSCLGLHFDCVREHVKEQSVASQKARDDLAAALARAETEAKKRVAEWALKAFKGLLASL